MSEVRDLQGQINASKVHDILGVPVIVGPEGQVHTFEGLLPGPRKIDKKVFTTSVSSFIAYTGRFSTPGTLVNVDAEKYALQARLNAPVDSAIPTWDLHLNTYQADHSLPWVQWNNANEQTFSQVEFAEWLEDHVDDIVQPTGAEMLELVLKFNIIRKVSFSSATRLQDGTFQFAYSDDTQKGTVEVPENIVLGIAPFKNGTSYEIKARLRYRLNEGRLTFSYKLLNTERILDDAFNEIVDTAQKGLPGVDFFMVKL